MQGTPIAVPWYTPESYAAVIRLLPPGERRNPLTYDRFMAQTEAAEKGIRGSGNIPDRIPIDAVELKAWHDHNHLDICRVNISAYVQIKLAKILRKSLNN
jgi:hypothetical protein